ncbi:oligomeric Golgi complex subunit 5 [Lasiosphaeria miniovina]|uniref:Conserved oligomeric Golgi complex subunit 5 n=1 Tax=Lasiosphaeria miniovina TaxID=1954250 RepID=A0AA40DRJ6_9PEZI|nr:oligomeric Golgi complex subunit 5 [Lasiosphaeria miniovina]KAK0713554.1 oligomeric Golgi complex subunit 5 [Lasiosphaeria miniovina]
MSARNVDDGDEPSYIDYETFLDPAFSPPAFANTLVLATNNPNDAPLDLSTPLSRVLFDIQEIDSHIDVLTSRSAVPLLSYTKEQTDSSTRIVTDIDTQIRALNDSYKQLEKEVIQKHAEADEVRHVASRLWDTLRLGRAVGRCLQLGRQLEVQHGELAGSSSAGATNPTAPPSSASRTKEDHRALVRCAHTLLSLRELLSSANTADAEGFGIDRVNAVRSLRDAVVNPTERSVRETAERLIREFSVGTALGSATFAQSEEARARTISALTTLYLLSPTDLAKGQKWAPTLMLQALEAYLRTALQSSIAGLSRALATLPSLERALAEVSARCQNVVALEAVLETTRTPVHPLLAATSAPPAQQQQHAAAGAAAPAEKSGNLLQPLLAFLETGSLASYFWRTMASSMASRVHEIAGKGGAAARTLRANRQAVADAIRDCVVRGSQLPSAVAAGAKGKTKTAAEGVAAAGHWEREVAVMVGSVVNNLGR